MQTYSSHLPPGSSDSDLRARSVLSVFEINHSDSPYAQEGQDKSSPYKQHSTSQAHTAYQYSHLVCICVYV